MLPVDAVRSRELHSEVLNALLPADYAEQLPEEAAESLRLALDGLKEATAVGDLSRGATFHCGALRRHLALKHKLTDDERVEAIHVLYRLVIADVPVALPLTHASADVFA